ncbi:MAG: S8 family serine peptidase [Bacteroidales bacterium]|nr:S8 family serine peptidase [Bacteroidales bacterium]
MKKTISILCFMLTLAGLSAQNVYWVFLTDKAGTTFDPYSYFDAKAIERYNQCGADLNDISNYPLNGEYVSGVDAIATEEVGTSRWMNAIGVVATPAQAEQIEALPYVKRVQLIGGNMQLAWSYSAPEPADNPNVTDTNLTDQLLRMQGNLFREKGIDGKGMRIAVLDGGFPKVNTHIAFKHLRDNGQILKTWNFPNRKENVYGWNGHGTMTLSNIAGRNADGKDLGLATGAEFLLARTEVEPEPFKEEVWWMQAMEWADRNGANLISSSLGYGKDRYYTKDMDGKSYVAKAGNLAAKKGILVVCSAGNEGDDSHWKFIVTPSDADSVLCIGGIEHSLKSYEHISFASFGPSADGRQKPNVCAFAHTWAATPHGGADRFEMVYGTSFSCPLVAGFAACAWQMNKEKTAMEMFQEIQRSADLYPYCDYAFGYGVPQASYFTERKSLAKSEPPMFRFEENSSTMVSVIPVHSDSLIHLFYKDVDENGKIVRYGKLSVNVFDTAMSLDFNGGHHLVVTYLKNGEPHGYTADYQFSSPSDPSDDEWASVRSNNPKIDYWTYDELERNPTTDRANEKRWEWDEYFLFGTSFATSGDELPCNIWSPAARVGVRLQYHFAKAYGIGLALEYGFTSHQFNNRDTNDLESLLGLANTINTAEKISQRRACTEQLGLEIFQRVRFMPGGSLFHKGLHWDLGAYLTYAWNDYRLKYTMANDPIATSYYLQLNDISPLSNSHWLYGLTTRITYDAFGIYARYNLNGIGQTAPAGQMTLPRLEVGLQLLF